MDEAAENSLLVCGVQNLAGLGLASRDGPLAPLGTLIVQSSLLGLVFVLLSRLGWQLCTNLEVCRFAVCSIGSVWRMFIPTLSS